MKCTTWSVIFSKNTVKIFGYDLDSQFSHLGVHNCQIECLNHIYLLDCVALITIFDQGPCGTFQIMKDHYNDIDLYTPLTVHAVILIVI